MASLAPTLLLRIPRAALVRRDAVERLSATWQARKLFAFKCDELEFARALLARRTNLWLFRTSQRAFAGDFLIVDVSPTRPDRRRVVVVELKRGDPLRVASPTAVQLRNTPAAVRELADAGIVGADCAAIAVIGNSDAVLRYLAD
jgi:hypothetical protein